MNSTIQGYRTMLVLLAFVITADPKAHWTEYRGTHGNGLSKSRLPTRWSERENIRWKTAIHDKGWSSPVVWGDQIWLTTAREDGQEFYAVAIERTTGAIIHDLSLFKESSPAFCHAFNSYASPTPVIENGRIYCHFGSHGTVCLDTATGRPVWSNFTLKCDHYRGPGSSPILHGDLLILTFDGVDVQYLAALNKATGEIVWKTDRAIKFRNDYIDFHKAFATPCIIRVNGQDQLIAPAAQETIAYDPKTGKELWRVTTGGMNQAIRPILAHGLVYLSGGHEQKLFAVDPGTATIAWKAAKEAPTRSSVLVCADRLYMVNDKGIATCLDAKTGRPIWRERLDGDFTASPVSDGQSIAFANESGKTFVIQAADQFKLVSVNKLDAGCLASPALLENSLILRTRTHLYCITD